MQLPPTPLYYAGIGSRRAPPEVLRYMQYLASKLALRGYVLRSGAADGADTAFEAGCVAVNGAAEIWLPWPGFNGHADTKLYPTEGHRQLAAQVHPAWASLTRRGPIALHSRNVGQALGMNLNAPVSFVLCWTPDGCESEATRTLDTGGTGTAIALASRLGIPVFNLAQADARDRLVRHVLADWRVFQPDSAPRLGVLSYESPGLGQVGVQVWASAGYVPCERSAADGRSPTGKKAPAAAFDEPALKQEITEFMAQAKRQDSVTFYVTRPNPAVGGIADADLAPLFALAPANCVVPDAWRPWLGPSVPAAVMGINIFSGTAGLGGALTNMSERAHALGCVKHHYPVQVGSTAYPDAEAAYQALKVKGSEAYNDRLMVDIIALKFKQHPKLLALVTANGGVDWLSRCAHWTGAKSARFQAWEGGGRTSRFIRNLMDGYTKATTGVGSATHVVHVSCAPYDVYIGRQVGDLPQSPWHNPYVIGRDGTRAEVVAKYYARLDANPELRAQVAVLKGKTLGCWCKDRVNFTELCHGDVLASVAETGAWEPPPEVQPSLF